MFSIEVNDRAVNAALEAIAQRVGNLQPILQGIGEEIMERAKQRFSTSTGADGQRWQPNAVATVQALIEDVRGKKGGVQKNGNLSKKSQATLAGKKVLIDTGALARQFHVSSNGNSVTVGNSMIYAAIHQFGGQAGRGRKVTIPARPFLPVKQDGSLYPTEQAAILSALNDYLAGK
ncbi:phage virion morphogenesis protein [Azonexus sp.]|uniref:phage virion morphogenesis protein n=1 Tax=Azonexus sp. TaxID=1872668 RepID=UPI0027BA12F7|nr:phage virion morphogenesis protein [Azonexus sp.]